MTTDAAVAMISTGDFLLSPPVPVSAFTAPTQAGRDTGDVDRIYSLRSPAYDMTVGLTTGNEYIDKYQRTGGPGIAPREST